MKKLLLFIALSASVYGKAQSCTGGVIFTSGPNAYSTGGNSCAQNCLSYNAALNTVLWTHRVSPYWNFPNYTSGCIQSTWLNISTNKWDSMLIYRDSTIKHARYPGGTIFNPSGNTNIANAFMMGTGPVTDNTNWTGTWYSSRQPSGNYHAATSSPSDSGFCHTGHAPFGNMASNGATGNLNADMQQVGNTVFVAGTLFSDTLLYAPNYLPNKGAVIGKAMYSGGNFTWSADSIIPNFYFDTLLGYLNRDVTRIAFSPNGQIGYVVFIGRLATNYGNPSADSSLTPIVYKSTNGGATWSSTSILPGFDWGTGHPEMLQSIGYLHPHANAFTPYAPNGIDVTVDSTGTLHLVTTVTNAERFVTGHIDSLAFDYIYHWDYTKHHPIIWDMMTDGTTWNTILVDSIKTSCTDNPSGDTASTFNPWAVSYGARVQVSRSVTGGKIFYAWADSDTSQTHNLYNTNPDIYMKSYDISNQLVTATNTVTSIGQCYFHYLSDVSYYDNTISGYVCPLVYTTPATATPPFNSADTVHYNYLNCANFYTSQYNTPASVYRTQGSSGIAKFNTQNSTLHIYPNPANNKIIIDATDVVDVKLFDVLGKQITSTKTNEIDVSSLNDGVYFMQVQTKQNTSTQKIIVQH